MGAKERRLSRYGWGKGVEMNEKGVGIKVVKEGGGLQNEMSLRWTMWLWKGSPDEMGRDKGLRIAARVRQSYDEKKIEMKEDEGL